jgi:hypothetical protein
MRLRFGTFAILFVAISTGNANALFLGIDGHDPTQPFVLAIPQNGSVLLDHAIQITNTFSTVSVLAWQLDLQLRPLAGAQGSLLFQSTGTPEDGLFAPDPEPETDLDAPSDRFIATDGDNEFVGVPITQNEHRNILKTTIWASPNASGTFELVTPEFGPSDDRSSWMDPDIEPHGFENSTPSSIPGYILIGTIQITPTALVGDYDDDQVVDNLDYGIWLASFGAPAVPAGQGADGNHNGVIDAADYVVWRKSVTAGSGALLAEASNVPEPVCLAYWITAVVVILLILLTSRFRSRGTNCPYSVATLRP